MSSQLVTDALLVAVWRRGSAVAVLHHQDHDSQFTNEHFQDSMREQGIRCSLSRAGEVWDNSAMERFFGSMKTERMARKVNRNREEIRADAFDSIWRFYNPLRRHSTLGCQSDRVLERSASLRRCQRNRQQPTA